MTGLPIVPNAMWSDGFAGMNTPAGSGRHLTSPKTTICRVMTLDDYDPAKDEPIKDSFRYALEEVPGPKTIVFEVGGTIWLKRELCIYDSSAIETHTKLPRERTIAGTGKHITIAGQTAPSPGITIANHGIRFGSSHVHDILVQHIRVRVGDKNMVPGMSKPDVTDPITLPVSAKYDPNDPRVGAVSRVVFDHCSFSWGGDINVGNGPDDVVFQNCIIGECLSHPWHPKGGWWGGHSMGMLLSSRCWPVRQRMDLLPQTAVVNNLFIRNDDRNPLIGGYKALVSNNVLYDYRRGIRICGGDLAKSDHKDHPTLVTVVGNYCIDEMASSSLTVDIYPDGGKSKVFLGDGRYPANFMQGKLWPDLWDPHSTDSKEGRKAGQADPCRKFETRIHFTKPDTDTLAENRTDKPPVWPKGYRAMTAEQAREYVLANVGARPADRDAVDKRFIREVRNPVKKRTGAPVAPDDRRLDDSRLGKKLKADIVVRYNYDARGRKIQGNGKVPENWKEDVFTVTGYPANSAWPSEGVCEARPLEIPENYNDVTPGGYTVLEKWLHDMAANVEGKNQ